MKPEGPDGRRERHDGCAGGGEPGRPLLERAKIHGPVVHLVTHGTRLIAASELGDHLVWDLRVYHEPYCTVLRRVWADVPIVWENGLPGLRDPPAGHECSGATPPR